MSRFISFPLIAVLSLLSALPLSGATITLVGSFILEGATVPEVAVGDVFDFTLTLDDSVIDTGTTPNVYIFENAVTAISLARRGSNTGTYDPSGAVISSSTVGMGQLGTAESIGVTVNLSGLPDLGEEAADSFFVQVAWTGTSYFNGNSVPPASGLSMGAILNDPFSLAGVIPASTFALFSAESFASPATGPVSAFAQVPEPGAGVLAAGSLLFLLRRRRHK